MNNDETLICPFCGRIESPPFAVGDQCTCGDYFKSPVKLYEMHYYDYYCLRCGALNKVSIKSIEKGNISLQCYNCNAINLGGENG